MEQDNSEGKGKIQRIQNQIKTNLSPKFTEMKTGARVSRFGRPQKEAKQDANSIPTELAKFLPKHSPKRSPKSLKTKDNLDKSTESQNENLVNNKQEGKKDSEENIPVEVEMELLKSETSDEVEMPPQTESIKDEREITTCITLIESEESEKPISVKMEKELHITDVIITNGASENSFDGEKEVNLSKEEACDEEKGKQEFSDTDSALGSASSYHDGKSLKTDDFFAGKIMWGSFNRTSWYPCMIYPNSEGNVLVENPSGKTKLSVHVKYFNYNGYVALLPAKNVFDYKDLDDFFTQVADHDIKKGKLKPFSKSCYKAMEEANFFNQYPIEERIKVFDEILQHQLGNKSTNRKSSEGKEKPSAPERKSVDSALDSPTPSSPQHEKDTVDPILCYLRAMKQYDTINVHELKKEPKASTVVKVETITAAVQKSQQGDDPNRRRSSRAVKKRKFEDFEEELHVNIESKPLELSTSLVEQPKTKKQRIVREESLEERFLIDVNTLRSSLRNFPKKRACVACLQTTSDKTFKCSGNGDMKCSGWFHEKCAARSEKTQEGFRFQCGDADEFIQREPLVTSMVCNKCNEGVKNCIACTEPIEIESEDWQQCPQSDCHLGFHKKCLKLWPQNQISRGSHKRNNQCPQHTCHTCFSKDIHNAGPLVKCIKCPSAYHLEISCVPAGSTILSQTQLICPRHPNEKEFTRNAKDKNSKPVNIDWCNACMKSGSLVCCDSCPSAFHPSCIDYEESDDKYICQECQEGRLPLYNMIVWARVGTYRWWPGLIMPKSILPDTVLKTQKSDREFCIRFFGSYDYFWLTCERVFQYDGMNLSVKGGSSRIDSAFNIALEEAHQMSELIANVGQQYMTAKPKPYTRLLQNRPVHPVKLKKVDEHNRDTCTCSEGDADPCGRTSECINMYLNVECNKSTCPAKANCRNQKFRNREYAELKIVKTSHRGFGAISVKDLPEDTFVVEYVGELIDQVELNRRMEGKLKNKEKDFYFLTVEGDLFVDAEPAGNLARFINHSCDPNCLTRKVAVDGNTRIGIFTNRFVKAGTELTFDYQMEFVGNKKTSCFCGSSKCSGLIGEKPKEVKVEKKQHKQKRKIRIKAIKSGSPAPSTSSSSKASSPGPQSRPVKRRRTLQDSTDPMHNMMDKMIKPPKSQDAIKQQEVELVEEQNPEISQNTIKETELEMDAKIDLPKPAESQETDAETTVENATVDEEQVSLIPEIDSESNAITDAANNNTTTDVASESKTL